jgi:hypothetical protein
LIALSREDQSAKVLLSVGPKQEASSMSDQSSSGASSRSSFFSIRFGVGLFTLGSSFLIEETQNKLI